MSDLALLLYFELCIPCVLPDQLVRQGWDEYQ